MPLLTFPNFAPAITMSCNAADEPSTLDSEARQACSLDMAIAPDVPPSPLAVPLTLRPGQAFSLRELLGENSTTLKIDTGAILIARMRDGDDTALTALHELCGTKLFAIALRFVRRQELAHEVVSITLMQAWTGAAGFDPARGSALTWLGAIAQTRALDLLRRERSRGKHECSMTEDGVDEMADTRPGPSMQLERSQTRSKLSRAMSLLSPIQRQVLCMTFLEGLSQLEAATHFGLPLGTVKSHSRRGLAILRAHAGLRASCAASE